MILWIALAAGVGVLFAYWRWGAIPTPIPKTVLDVLPRFGTHPLVWAWRVFLVAVLLLAVLVTMAINPAGFVAYALAGVLIWAVLDDIRAAMSDIWHLRVWWFEP